MKIRLLSWPSPDQRSERGAVSLRHYRLPASSSARLAADQRQRFPCFAAHQHFVAAAFDVQADQRLGMRRTQVEAPLLELEAHAVGVIDGSRHRLILSKHLLDR